MLVGLGFGPGTRELGERWRLSASPELHGEHPCDGAIAKPAIGEFTERADDARVLLRVPAVIQTVVRSRPRGWIVVPHDLSGDASRLTHLAGGQVAANASQHDGLSISILRGFRLSVGILGQNLVGDLTIGTETSNLFEVQVVQLIQKSCSLVFCEL